MSRSLFLAATAAFAVTAIGCAGDPVGTAPSFDAVASLQTADHAPFEVSASTVTLQPGDSEQLTVRKVANGQVVPETSVSWSSSDPAVATVSDAGLVTAVAAGEATISVTRGVHRVDVAVTVSGCAVRPLPLGVFSGELTAQDCPFVSGRPADFFAVGTTAGQILEFEVTGMDARVGFKEATLDPRGGRDFGSVKYAPLRVIANGGPLQVYVRSGNDTFGSYTLRRSAPTEAHDCAVYNFVTPGASFSTTVTDANACHYPVRYSPVPEAIGKPLVAHGFNILLTELKPYTVTITGLTDSFDPALTVFGNTGVVAQAVPGPLPTAGTRSVTFTPATAGYYYIEVSGGRFIDAMLTWDAQKGPYHMTISQ